ncbi:pentapeptide repeat-containing protein [Dolichospermum sp. UHCC 0259]|uniref:pentapeptide repeat-containing protein n=1 Tax=Dolichospermum sp. UHCC 0259 TaxID=2590010 RepID=UPI001446129F|nr:pentapeptide repeat-containing protein [Dolichospermum sp. UHCC 0259]MTJ48280.1 pentapeptide repeat-containing protein [Dolichospermum sp. UHCC 0259]
MNNPQQPLEYDAVLGGENQISSSPDLKMTTERAVNLLKAGDLGIRLWNKFRKEETYIPSLEGVDLSGQDLHYANFSNANLQGAKLTSVYYANFSNANLQGAKLTSVYCANFSNANLQGADLSSAYAEIADFSNADLTDTKFDGGNLSRAKLKNAIIANTSFLGTNLEGADVTGTKIFLANVNKETLTDEISGIDKLY